MTALLYFQTCRAVDTWAFTSAQSAVKQLRVAQLPLGVLCRGEVEEHLLVKLLISGALNYRGNSYCVTVKEPEWLSRKDEKAD